MKMQIDNAQYFKYIIKLLTAVIFGEEDRPVCPSVSSHFCKCYLFPFFFFSKFFSECLNDIILYTIYV